MSYTEHVAWRSACTFIFLCEVVCHLPVLVAVQDVVGNVQVVGCHLVDALGNAYEGRQAAAPLGTLFEALGIG